MTQFVAKRFVILFPLFAATALAADQSVRVDVTVGGVKVTNWIVEQHLDLPAAARLLGLDGEDVSSKLRVLELDDQGQSLGARAFQIDRASMAGHFVVTWRMPGPTPAGTTRRFLIALDGEGQAPGHDEPINATRDGEKITIKNGPVVLEHAMDAGGMISRVDVGATGGAIKWNDRIWGNWYWKGRREFHLADHKAESMKIVAAGPLRVVVETRSDYLNDGDAPNSHPRATYRFTTHAGQPVTRVEALATQNFQKFWFHFRRTEMDLARASVNGTVRDESAGNWAAAFSNDLLIGIADGSTPTVEGGPMLASAANTQWRTLDQAWQATLFWGAGKKEVNRLKTWSAILDSPPTTTIHLPPLTKRITAVVTVLDGSQKKLSTLTAEPWARHHVQTVVARSHVANAKRTLAAGAFGDAERALQRAEATLHDDTGHLNTTDTVVAGLVAGHPYLGNDHTAYVWSHVDEGAGLLSVYDRRTGRELLEITPAAAGLWRIAVKKGEGGTNYSNTGTPCTVTGQPRGLSFTWNGAWRVGVQATLDPDETVVRMRLNARAGPADEGLLTVMFPIVDGILPLSPGGTDDMVLDSQATGYGHRSPLVNGKTIWSPYPHGMQFNAMFGDGQGLYVADHDPQANAKDLTWSPRKRARTLNFTITHPLLGWAGSTLIKDYASPGDIVIGPFEGDWYDAAQIYRKWALTAPWCAKGPIHARTDYPRWLAEAPYWTIGHLGFGTGVQDQIDIVETFGVPIGISHVYGWWFQPHQDDGYPDYFPPRLGSVGMKRAVQELQRSGMRVVPYVNGLLWDQGNESWKADNAEQGAIKGPDGQVLVLTFSGNRHVAMCPGSSFWRDRSTEFCKQLAGRYGVDGVYFDFLTAQFGDCYDTDHGHAVGGGNFWTASTRAYYKQMRDQIKRLNPDTLLTGEHNAEWTIDILDTQLAMSDEKAPGVPLFQAVYHGYTLLFGQPGNRGVYRGDLEPQTLGRWWLRGNQNGWYNQETTAVRALKGDPKLKKWLPHARNYLKLLYCSYHFARPYLTYGRMLRPPRIEGELPTVHIESPRGSWRVSALDASAWQAPDDSVGVFILNYDQKQAHEFSWIVDLKEDAGWSADTRVILSKWTREEGITRLGEVAGGMLRRQERIEPWGLIALKLEATD